MRRLVLLILALATLLPSLASAYDVLILQSRHDPAYTEVLKGFGFERKTSLRILVLADYADVDVVRIVREDRPRVILALGDTALKTTRTIRNTPVVAVMALSIDSTSAVQRNLSGISMFAAPDRYIDMFREMKAGRVGVLHNPAKSGWYLRKARQAATEAGIELVVREVLSPRDTVKQLDTLSGKVDALWMLPDTTAVTRETTEAYFRFGQENSVPVVSFAESYIGLGAAAAMDINRLELGRQADRLTSAILHGKSAVETEFPHKTSIRVNPTVLKRLGLAYAGHQPQ